MRLFAPAALLVLALPATAVRAAESYDNCVGFIDALPVVITTQGVWCLRADLATSIASGNAIQVNTNNVTIDCNGFKLGGLGAGPSSSARAIHSSGRQNLTVRNCLIRGFQFGIAQQALVGGLIEDNVIEGSYSMGIFINGGEDTRVQRNRVRDTGKAPSGGYAYGIQTVGVHDVIDNTVTGVQQGTAVGIGVDSGPGAIIKGNHVRGLAGQDQSFGISMGYSPGALVRDNHVRGPGTTGIRCSGEQAMVVDNTASDFSTGVSATCLTSDNVVQEAGPPRVLD